MATEWRTNRPKTQVNHTFEVSQVYFIKDSNLLPHLEDWRIIHTFFYKLIGPYILANTTYATAVLQGTLKPPAFP